MAKLGSWQQRQKEIAQEASTYTRVEADYQKRIGAVPGKRFEESSSASVDLANFDRTLAVTLSRYDAYNNAVQQVVGDGEKRLPPIPDTKTQHETKKQRELLNRAFPDLTRADGKAPLRFERDRRANFLWALWALQLQADGLYVPEYTCWSEALAARALLRLIGVFPDGYNLLLTLYQDQPERAPDEASIRHFYERYDPLPPIDQERAVELFLSRLYRQVPGAQSAVHLLLGSYGAEVRLAVKEAPVGEQPLDTLADVPRPASWHDVIQALGSPELEQMSHQRYEEDQLATAVALYRQGYTGAHIEKSIGVPRYKLYAETKRLGITRPTGRKKKKA